MLSSSKEYVLWQASVVKGFAELLHEEGQGWRTFKWIDKNDEDDATVVEMLWPSALYGKLTSDVPPGKGSRRTHGQSTSFRCVHMECSVKGG